MDPIVSEFEKKVLQRLAQKTLEARTKAPAPEPMEETPTKEERLPYEISKHVQEMKSYAFHRQKQHQKTP